jgi:hypothetical protein
MNHEKSLVEKFTRFTVSNNCEPCPYYLCGASGCTGMGGKEILNKSGASSFGGLIVVAGLGAKMTGEIVSG